MLNDEAGAYARTIEGRMEHQNDLQYKQHKNLFATSYSTIHKAACDGSESGIHYFLNSKQKPRVNADDYDKFGICPIHYAAERGHEAVITLLLSKGCNIDIPTTDGMTAFMYAAKNNQLSTMNYLVERGASILSVNRAGMSAAHFAAQLDHLPVFERLLELNVLAKENCLAEIAEAEMAAENPDELAADKAKKAKIGQKDAKNVATSSSSGKEEKGFADESSVIGDDDDDSTVMSGATNSSAPKLGGGATQTAPGAKVKAPGGADGAEELDIDPVEALRQKYAPLLVMKDTAIVDIPSRNGTRPCHIASTYNSLRVLELLIKVGSEINGIDTAGENSLHKAARRCNTDAFKMLVAAGGYENVKNTSRETAAELLKDASFI
jgi:ankyrin repeat protein